jgi:hypothetical protein
MLLKSQILDAQSKSKSARGCARYLKVSYPTYKKWAKYHGVFENLINESGKGIPKKVSPRPHLLEPYITGQKAHPIPRTYMKMLIKHGAKEDMCESCGYSERRIDGKQPFLLNYKDGNKHNSHIDNVEILCYNCYYVNVGNEIVADKRRKYWTPSYFNTAGSSDIGKFDYDKMIWDDIDMDSVDMDSESNTDEKDIDELFKKLNE